MAQTVLTLFGAPSSAEAARDTLVQSGFAADHVTVLASDPLADGVPLAQALSETTGVPAAIAQGCAQAVRDNMSALVVAVARDDAAARVAAILDACLGVTTIPGANGPAMDNGGSNSSGSLVFTRSEAASASGAPFAAPVAPVAVTTTTETIETTETTGLTGVTEAGTTQAVPPPVARPLADDLRLDPFQEGTITVVEHAEVPVIEKTSRVVEEVVVRKQAGEHVEIMTETVRRTDVEVERFDAENAENDAATNAAPATVGTAQSGAADPP